MPGVAPDSFEQLLRLVQVEAVGRHRRVVADRARHELVRQHARPGRPPSAFAIASRSMAYSIAWRSFRLSLNGGFFELKKNWCLLPWNGDSI